MGSLLSSLLFKDNPTDSFWQNLSIYCSFYTAPITPNPRLSTSFLGFSLPSPIAGGTPLDLNAGYFPQLLKLGLGYIELGPVSPVAESSRLPYLSLSSPHALQIRIEPSLGASYLKHQLSKSPNGIRGVNMVTLHENISHLPHKTDEDFFYTFLTLYPFADFFSINLCESPFRHIGYYKKPFRYQELLKKICELRDLEIGLQVAFERGLIEFVEYKARRICTPFIVRVGTAWGNIEGLVECCVENGVEGLAVGSENESVEAAREVLERVVRAAKGRIQVVSYGGVTTGKEVLERIKRGASAVEVFSVLMMHGGKELGRIQKELEEELEAQGFESADAARGSYYKDSEIKAVKISGLI